MQASRLHVDGPGGVRVHRRVPPSGSDPASAELPFFAGLPGRLADRNASVDVR
jgi:hypothetical protein